MENKDGQKLAIKYPSLEAIYEHIKDTLKNEAQELADLSLKATFLWGAVTMILGIAIPILNQVGKVTFNSPLLTWLFILYGLITAMSWWIMFPKRFYDTLDFNTLWSEFSGLAKERFWHDMFVHISEASEKNQHRLSVDAWLIRFISLATLLDLVVLLIWIRISVIIT